MSSSGKVVLSYGDYVIRESELRILESKEWLNDVLIGFYLEYLGKEGGNEMTGSIISFIGPEVAQLLKMLPSDQVQVVLGQDLVKELTESPYILIPINDSSDPEIESGGSHWSLLLFCRRDAAFIHFDSSVGDSNSKDAKQLTTKLGPILNSTSPTFSNWEGCSKQSNCYDCGLHVISNAQLIFKYLKDNKGEPELSFLKSGCPTASPQDAKEMRSKLLNLIPQLAKAS